MEVLLDYIEPVVFALGFWMMTNDYENHAYWMSDDIMGTRWKCNELGESQG